MSRIRVLVRAALLPGLFVVTAVFIPVRAKAIEVYTSPRNADVDARGARSVRIEASAGDLRVEGRPGITQARIRGTARANRRAILDDIKLIAERRGDVVFIKADIPTRHIGLRDIMNGDAGQMELDLVIEIPTTLAIDAADGSGNSEFNNTGGLSFSDGSGELFVRGAHGNVRITDGSGNVTVDGVEGSVMIDDGSGNIRASNVTGDFTVGDDGSGDIDVSGVGGSMRVENDGSGNIRVGRVAGDFVVGNDGSGLIRYDTVKGNIRIPERKHRS